MPHSPKGLRSTIRLRVRLIDRAANRYRNFSPQTISRLIRAGLALLCLALFLRLGSWIQSSGLMPPMIQGLDNQMMTFIGNSMRSSDWDFFVLDLSSLGSLAVVVTISFVSAVLLILSRDPAAALHLGLVALGGFKIAAWAKAFFDRPRPDIIPKLIQVGGKSFPSGHAVTASAIYLTLAILAARHFQRPRARAALFLLAALLITLVSFSRVYMGVHYPSDVFSGTLLGAAWALLMGALFSRRSSHPV